MIFCTPTEICQEMRIYARPPETDNRFSTARWHQQHDELSETHNGIPIRFQGYVKKRGKINTAYKMRYLVLDNHNLRYYADQTAFEKNSNSSLGELCCRGMTVVSTDSSSAVSNVSNVSNVSSNVSSRAAGFAFIITGEQKGMTGTKWRDLECLVETEREHDAWKAQVGYAANANPSLLTLSHAHVTPSQEKGGGGAHTHLHHEPRQYRNGRKIVSHPHTVRDKVVY